MQGLHARTHSGKNHISMGQTDRTCDPVDELSGGAAADGHLLEIATLHFRLGRLWMNAAIADWRYGCGLNVDFRKRTQIPFGAQTEG
jgi:hypothetical protein